MPADDVLTRSQIDAALAKLPDWRYVGDLRTVLKCSTSAIALDLFAKVGRLAQEANHHPDVDWRYDTLFIATSSHDAGGQLTKRDFALAEGISAAAAELEAVAEPEKIRRG